MEQVEAFQAEHGGKVEAFMDRNGYLPRDLRALVRHAIALWEIQHDEGFYERNTLGRGGLEMDAASV